MKTSVSRFYLLGVDPAPSRGSTSDDGALAVLRVSPRQGVAEPTGNTGDWRAEAPVLLPGHSARCSAFEKQTKGKQGHRVQ